MLIKATIDIYQCDIPFKNYIDAENYELLCAMRNLDVNENILYTTYAVCDSYKLTHESISEMVSWGIANPCGNKPERWLFTYTDCERIARAQRFSEDLEINIPGAALTMQLIEEIQKLREKRC